MARPRDPAIDERVLQATAELLAEVGYDALTIEAVAERSQTSKPSIYRRWSSLAQLVFELLAQATQPLELPETGTFRGDLVLMVQTFVAATSTMDRALLADQFGTMIRDADFAQTVFDATIEPLNRRAAVLYERAADRGEVRPDVDATRIMQDVAAQLLFRVAVLHQDVSEAEARQLADRLIDGVAARRDGTEG